MVLLGVEATGASATALHWLPAPADVSLLSKCDEFGYAVRLTGLDWYPCHLILFR